MRPRLRFQLHRLLWRSLSGFCPNRLLASRRPPRRRSRTQLLLHLPTHRSLWRSSARLGEFSCRWTSQNSGVVLQEDRLGFMSIWRRVPVHQLFQRRWRPGAVLLMRIVQPRRRCAMASGCSTTLVFTIIMSSIIMNYWRNWHVRILPWFLGWRCRRLQRRWRRRHHPRMSHVLDTPHNDWCG